MSVGYKKCDIKTTEGMASGTKENTKAFCLVAEPVEVLQKIGFAFVGILAVGFKELRLFVMFLLTLVLLFVLK